MMNITDVKFRCSSLGRLMTESRSGALTDKQAETMKGLEQKALDGKITDKQLDELTRLRYKRDNPALSETTKTLLVEMYIFHKYGIHKDITNRYITKGLNVEEDSATLYSRYKRQFFKKNEERKSDADFEGTADIVLADRVDDLKSSWDIFTFLDTVGDDINSTYEWQLQGYMELYDKENANLCYCLVNTPESLISDEKRKLAWKMNLIDPDANPDYVKAAEEIDLRHTYDHFPIEDRVNIIPVQRDREAIARARKKAAQCRAYMLRRWPKFYCVGVPVAALVEA